jgi:predicted ferric reductase
MGGAVRVDTAKGAHRSVPPRAAGPGRHARVVHSLLAGGLIGIAVLSVAFVVVLWMSTGSLRELAHGRTVASMSLGRLAGLIASDLLLIQVTLMSRIPLVERTFGQDRLAGWHRWVGFTSFHLMIVHIGLTWIGYSWEHRTGYVRELWDIVVTLPGMLMATVGALLLCMVVAISLRAARRRLRYESWHLLHLYAYLGVGLGLPHQLWTGTGFLSSRAATLFWWTSYGLVAVGVLVFRLGLPAWRNMRHRLKVDHVVVESPGVVSIHMSGADLDRLPVRAGQFFQWRFLDGPGWTRAHPYSLSAAPGSNRLRITVRETTGAAPRLAHLRAGTGVLMEGPYGRLTARAGRGRGVTMCAAGIGITPLRALLEELAYPPGEANLIYRASTEDDVILRDELEAIAAARGVRLHIMPGHRGADGTWQPAGWEEIPISAVAPDINEHDVYVCGPPAWMRAVTEDARRAGVPARRIHRERFGW